jgi:RNA polymerase sigma-70 factor (ECF subfamily)
VANEVIAHEGAVRAWLRRSRVVDEDAEELIQEAYCRLAMLDSVDHIDRADAYFFSIIRNLLVRRLKRAKIVEIDTIAEIESYRDDAPSPERQVAGRIDYARMLAFMDALPERCRTVVHLRKIEGWSQKRIAAHLEMSEKAVEKQVWLGVKAIQRAWRDMHEQLDRRLGAGEAERWRP